MPEAVQETVRRAARIYNLDSMPEMLNVEELAKVLGFGMNKTYQILRRPDSPIPYLRPGRVYRIPRRALAKVLEDPEKLAKIYDED